MRSCAYVPTPMYAVVREHLFQPACADLIARVRDEVEQVSSEPHDVSRVEAGLALTEAGSFCTSVVVEPNKALLASALRAPSGPGGECVALLES